MAPLIDHSHLVALQPSTGTPPNRAPSHRGHQTPKYVGLLDPNLCRFETLPDTHNVQVHVAELSTYLFIAKQPPHRQEASWSLSNASFMVKTKVDHLAERVTKIIYEVNKFIIAIKGMKNETPKRKSWKGACSNAISKLVTLKGKLEYVLKMPEGEDRLVRCRSESLHRTLGEEVARRAAQAHAGILCVCMCFAYPLIQH